MRLGVLVIGIIHVTEILDLHYRPNAAFVGGHYCTIRTAHILLHGGIAVVSWRLVWLAELEPRGLCPKICQRTTYRESHSCQSYFPYDAERHTSSTRESANNLIYISIIAFLRLLEVYRRV